MSMENFLSSGLSLERPDTPDAPKEIDVSAWEDVPGFSANIPLEDVNEVTSIAMDPTRDASERFEANHLLGTYYSDRNDLKRALYHIKTAMSFATTHAQKAGCHFNQLLCQLLIDGRDTLTPADIPLYDKWVEESLRGILEGDEAAIQGALEYTESWKDYGLAAAAALAWSTHPENTDAFDREAAEAAYHGYKKQFEEQSARKFGDVIYTRLPGESNSGIPCRAKVRLEFLQNHAVYSPQELFDHSPAGESPSAAPTAPKSEKEQRADELMAKVDQFARKYSQHARSLYSAKPDVLRDYIELVKPIITELTVGNVPLMRTLMDNSQVFEDMQDFMLLGATATLWLVHPENTDGREKIAVQKKSTLWMETAIALGEQFNDVQPLEWRLRELNMSERFTYDTYWTSLAQHVRDMVSG